MKYIVVTGGVVSGLGKGITISSIGRMLKSSGVRVTAIKIDPYMNTDAGTMSPFEHGETFVLDDGGETDLDLGNYERFLDVTLSGQHNITTGKIYREVLDRERRGDYLGKTVQIVPHATDMIISWIKDVAKRPVDGTSATPDVCLIEVGGTVGDIESMVFLEALRQLQFIVSPENLFFIHVSLVPVLGVVGEQKTKPTQHSVKELRSAGISPDVIVCRSSTLLDESTKHKLSAFCQVPATHVLSVHDVSNIYHVPLILADQGLHTIIREHLGLEEIMSAAPQFDTWRSMARSVDDIDGPSSQCKEVNIALVGKYTGLQDSYLSVIKALKHSAIHLRLKLNINWVDASELEEEIKLVKGGGAGNGAGPEEASADPAMSSDGLRKYETAWKIIQDADGILVPGGFGIRGVEGKVAAARYAREQKRPYLGICLGMQVMVIEYSRHVLGLKGANSTEFDESSAHPVVMFMPEINPKVMGGTMRLGARPTTVMSKLPTSEEVGQPSETTNGTVLAARSLASEIYFTGGFPEGSGGDCQRAQEDVLERHRHRYEVNPEYAGRIQESGLFFSGVDDKLERMEMAELPRTIHPFYFGTQFHPEFKSRPNRPSPPVCAFMTAAAGMLNTDDKLKYAGKLWQTHTEDLRLAREAVPPTSPYKQIASKALMSPVPSNDIRRKRSISSISEL